MFVKCINYCYSPHFTVFQTKVWHGGPFLNGFAKFSYDQMVFDTWLDSRWTLGQFSVSGEKRGDSSVRVRVRARTRSHRKWRGRVAVLADRRRGKPAQDETRMTGGQRTRIHNDTPSSEQACLVLLVKTSGHSRAELHRRCQLARLSRKRDYGSLQIMPQNRSFGCCRKFNQPGRQPCLVVYSPSNHLFV